MATTAGTGRPPAALTELIGRQQEIAAVRDLLSRPSVRLVTVTGAGGVGKTRLAVEVLSGPISGFDAVVFVPLAPVRDPDLVSAAIAGALDLRAPDDTLAEALPAFLQERRTLMVLDNVEHLLPAVPLVASLLHTCPRLTVLVTSRALLRISGEHVVTVPPLAVPQPGPLPPPSVLGRYDAVRLFTARARAGRPEFEVNEDNAADVAGICQRLDGLPLAIELAAARVGVLPPHALLARLDRRLPLLIDGARDLPDRLRTMRASVAWSYELLSPAEAALLRRMSVFAGTCSLAAAEAAQPSGEPAALDVITALVEQSMLRRATPDDGEPRFAMLETVREFASEQLVASGEEPDARRAHVAYFMRLAEAAEAGLRGSDQQHWRNALEADLDNVRAALTWTFGPSAGADDARCGLRLVGALWYFWFQRGLTGEARRWLARAIEQASGPPRDRAQALLGAGTLAWRQGDCDIAQTYLDESIVLWRADQDERGLAEARHVLGHVRFDQRDYTTARSLFQESLDGYERAHDVVGGLPLVGDVGLVAYHEGDYGTAERVMRKSLALYRHHGLTDRVAGALNGLGDLAQLGGDHARAAGLYEESLALWRQLHGTPGIASALHKLGQVRRSEHHDGRARELLTESLRLQRELGNKQGIGECLAGLAGTVASAGRPDRAARILAASCALLESIGVPLAPVDQLALDRDIEATRTSLGAEWDIAWAEGSAMTAGDAITLALRDDGPPPAAGNATTAEAGRLSPREREISRLVAEGLTNREIARALSITEKTVGSHIDHIMNKLGVRSRTRIAVWAVEQGGGTH